jgi:hypothetical protein
MRKVVAEPPAQTSLPSPDGVGAASATMEGEANRNAARSRLVVRIDVMLEGRFWTMAVVKASWISFSVLLARIDRSGVIRSLDRQCLGGVFRFCTYSMLRWTIDGFLSVFAVHRGQC